MALLLLSLSGALVSRLALPDRPNLWGVIDDLSLASLAAAFLGISSLLKKPLGSALGLLGIALVFLLGFVNGWYFEFYRGYLGLTSWQLLSDVGEAMASAGALSSIISLSLGGLVLALFGYGFVRTDWPHWTTKLRVIAVALTIFAGLQVVHGFRPSRQFHPSAESFLPRMLREAILKRGRPVASMQFLREENIAIEKLIPIRKGWRKPDANYPLYLTPVRKTEEPKNPLNVLLVVMEGIRASEMGIYGNARSATPQLDEISKEGLWASQYYSNSTQTVRAEVNLLCGVFDRLGGAPFSSREIPFDAICLPDILKRIGYATYWFHGYRRSFFSRGKFFPRLGFQNLHDIKAFFRLKGPEFTLGWGIRDRFVFEHALSVLENEKRPFFAEILTLSNHFPFNWPWGIAFPPALSGGGAEMFYNYRRGIYYSDHSIGLFWRRFKQSSLARNTIVIFVGDHGIWTFDPALLGQLGDFNKHEQYFRVPFIAVGPGIKARRLEIPVSHVDVQATVLSWLGVSTPTATIGRAFAGPEKTLEARSVFTLIEGSYGYRREDAYCVPTEITCFQEMFPLCAEGQQPSYGLACVRTRVDPLFTLLDGDNATSLPNYDLTDPDRLLAYMQKALEEADFAPDRPAASPRDNVVNVGVP